MTEVSIRNDSSYLVKQDSKPQSVADPPWVVLPTTNINNLKIENSTNAHIGSTIIAENLHVHPPNVIHGENVDEPSRRFRIMSVICNHRKIVRTTIINLGILFFLITTTVMTFSMRTVDDFHPKDLFDRSGFTEEDLLDFYYPTEEAINSLMSPTEMLPFKKHGYNAVMKEDVLLRREIMKSYFHLDAQGVSTLTLAERKRKLADIFKREPKIRRLWDIPLTKLKHTGLVRSEKKIELLLGRWSTWELICWIPQPGQKYYDKLNKGQALVTLSPTIIDEHVFIRIAYSLEGLKWGQPSSQEKAWPVWLLLYNANQSTPSFLDSLTTVFSFPVDEVLDPRNGYVTSDQSTLTPYYYLRIYFRLFAIY